MNIKTWCGVVLSLFGTFSFAAVPPDLMYHNKPIDTLCFANIANEAKEIDLKKCGLAEEKYVIKGYDAKLIEKNYIGYEWQSSDESQAKGYSYYKFFNAGKGQYWLYTLNNSGGSGEFSAILLVKRKDPDTLKIDILSGGDRCNGGLQDVSATNDRLRFSVNLTAYDLMALSNKSRPSVKAYDDLAGCAVCCVAKAVYQVTPSIPAQLMYVSLDKIKDSTELPEQGTYQSCFNKLFTSFITAGKSQLKQNQLDEFVDQFNKTCGVKT